MTVDIVGFVVAAIVAAAGAYGFHKAGKLSYLPWIATNIRILRHFHQYFNCDIIFFFKLPV